MFDLTTSNLNVLNSTFDNNNPLTPIAILLRAIFYSNINIKDSIISNSSIVFCVLRSS